MRIKSIFNVLFLVSFTFFNNAFADDISDLLGETLKPALENKSAVIEKKPSEPVMPVVEKPTEPEKKSEPVAEKPAEPEKKPEPVKPSAEKSEEPQKDEQETTKPPKKDKQEELAIEGLDTVSVREPEGNWLLKRIWWEKAKKKYAKIKRFASKIADLQLGFVEKRNKINRDVFDPFYVEVGLNYGQLKEVVSSLLQNLKDLREKEGSLDTKEKELLNTLKAEEKTLKQLSLDVKSIRSLNAAIDEDIQNLVRQINRSRRYEEDALQIFFDIAKVLSHKKARELKYQMDSLWKNIKSIDAYIRGKFSRHFDTVIENAKSQVEKIKTVASAFKDKGIDLKKQFAGREEKPTEKKPEKPEAIRQSQDDLEQKEEPVGWLGSIWNVITWPFKKFWGLFK